MSGNTIENLPSALDLIDQSSAPTIHKFIAQQAFVAGERNDGHPCAAEIVERAMDVVNYPADKMVSNLIEEAYGGAARYGCMNGCPGVFLDLGSDGLNTSLCQKRSTTDAKPTTSSR